MAAKGKRAVTPANRPEHKIGPFHGGLGVSIWLNTVETDKGPRVYRSVTVAPRRYRDEQTGNWKDAKSYRPLDLSTLILALQAARDYCSKVPLPGQPVEGEEMEELHLDNGEVPGDSRMPAWRRLEHATDRGAADHARPMPARSH
jgi:hypothetical protein